MRKLLWVLVVGVLVGIILTLVVEKRAAEGSRVKAMGTRVRDTAGPGPQLPRTDLKEPLDEAIEGAAGEVRGARAETAQIEELA